MTQRLILSFLLSTCALAEDWTQFQFNARHSGNAAGHELAVDQLTLEKTAPMSDGIYTSPVVADGKVYVVDGSGRCACFDAVTLNQLWSFRSKGGAQNVNNISSPAIARGHVYVGTSEGGLLCVGSPGGEAPPEPFSAPEEATKSAA